MFTYLLISSAEQMGIGDDIEYLAEIKGIISLCDISFELIKLFDSLNELHQRNITTAHDDVTSEVFCAICY